MDSTGSGRAAARRVAEGHAAAAGLHGLAVGHFRPADSGLARHARRVDRHRHQEAEVGASLSRKTASRSRPALAATAISVTVPADPAQPFVIDKSGAYWLEMTDEEDLTGGTQDRWEIRAIGDSCAKRRDRTTDRQSVRHRRCRDSSARSWSKTIWRFDDVILHFSRSAEAGVEDLQLPLFQGPESAPFVESQKSAVPQQGESRTIEHPWQLAALNLKPGTQLTFYATASDYLPQVGKSPERRITIITPRELEDRIAQRQALILGELEPRAQAAARNALAGRRLANPARQSRPARQARRRSRPRSRAQPARHVAAR